MRRRPLLILLLVVTAPLLASVVASIVQSGQDLFPGGDHAGLEAQTIFAEHRDQLTGTHSRFGWYHPAPTFFYVMGAFHWVLGKSPAGMNAAVTLLNLAAVALIVGVTWRQAGRVPALLAAAAMAVLLARLGPLFLRDYWVPYSVLLPFGAYVFVTAAVAAGELLWLPLLVGIGSFVAGNNLSAAPAVAALAVAGVVLCFLVRRFDPQPGQVTGRRTWVLVGASLLVAGALWALPVYDELHNDPGNISAIRHFFDKVPGEHTAADGMAALAYALDGFFWVPGPAFEPPAAPVAAMLLLMAVLVLLGLGAVVGIARRRRFGAALCVVSLAAMAAEVIATPNVRGPLYGYLVVWFGAIGPAIFVGVALSLGPELLGLRALRERGPALARGLALALAAVTVVSLVRLAGKLPLTRDGEYSAQYVVPLSHKLDAWLGAEQVHRPFYDFSNAGGVWGDGAPLATVRLRNGGDLAVGGPPQGAFGRDHMPNGTEDADVVVLPYSVQGPKGMRLLARGGNLSVWVHRRPG